LAVLPGALPQDEQDPLVAEHERDEGRRLQPASLQAELEPSVSQHRKREGELDTPSSTAAAVMLGTRNMLGKGARLARSVVSDIARKSLVMNSSTISPGISTAWPVSPSPIARNRTCLCSRPQLESPYALGCTSSSSQVQTFPVV
jgi:hypothetical protein